MIAMRERAGLIGGTLNITSTPGTGTTVTLVMPLRQEDHAPELEEHNILEEIVSPRS
jgi:signal transduction histidine kinase